MVFPPLCLCSLSPFLYLFHSFCSSTSATFLSSFSSLLLLVLTFLLALKKSPLFSFFPLSCSSSPLLLIYILSFLPSYLPPLFSSHFRHLKTYSSQLPPSSQISTPYNSRPPSRQAHTSIVPFTPALTLRHLSLTTPTPGGITTLTLACPSNAPSRN